ncbi:MAG: DUF4394 domain-containing protein [Gemmatimonadales bacterium]
MSNRLIALMLAALAAGCGGSSADLIGPGDPAPGDPQPPAPAEPPAQDPVLEGRPIFAVDLENRLMLFGTGSPDTLARRITITGLGTGHRIVSIDFRGDDGPQGLYGVGTDSRLYVIDTLSGVATPVGEPFHPEISGTHFGIAIDAEADQVRIHGVKSDQSVVLSASTGQLVSVDAPLAFSGFDFNAGRNPGVAGTAMRPSDGHLFGIEANKDVLVRMPEPALGALATVGSLGTTTTLCVGFDIANDGTAYAALTEADGSKLHTIDLATGAATLVGPIASDSPIQGIAIVSVPEGPQLKVTRAISTRRVSFRPAPAPDSCFDSAEE